MMVNNKETSNTPLLSGSTATYSTPLSGLSLTAMQVRALMKKDWIVARRHARRLVLELIFPLLMGTLSCLFMSFFLNLSGMGMSGGTVSPYCTGAAFVNYAPLNVTYPNIIGGQGKYCWSNSWTHFDNFTDLYNGYLANLEYQQQNWQYMNPSAIMFYQNFTEVSYPDFPMGALEFHTVNQFQARQGIALGNIAYLYFNNMTSYVDLDIHENSWPQQFNSFLIFSTAAAIMLSLTFLPMTTTLAGRLVDEKKAKVREHLRVMGVSPFSYLFAAFLVSLIRVSFVSFAMLILIGGFQIIDVGPLFLVWLSLIFYGFSLAGFAQIMPSFFSRSTMSNAVVSIFIVSTGIGAVFASEIEQLNPLLAILFSPSAFVMCIAQIMNKNYVTLNVTSGGAIGCLFFHMVFYNALAQYLYDINPGEFGVPRPLLYPLHDLRDLIWKPQRSEMAKSPTNSKSKDYEERIILEGLVKVFGNDTDNPAVNRLSLRVRSQEIFALLGHNGAGKTTTISMLIGMLTSTSYERAEILGMDLNTQLSEIRRSLAVCPQFDVLFDDLSGREHLELYAAIRGRPAAEQAVDALLNKLRLPLTDQRSSTFSGGMKRRLSVGNSLVGDAPIIFLDEPSSGLDPLSRRCLWELLKEERTNKGKSIVLTTHFMEEADYLGDRIAIMSHGRLFCCDTSARLKEHYGVGFYLQLLKDVGHEDGQHQERGMLREPEDPTEPVKPQKTTGPFRRDLVEDVLKQFTTNYVFHHESIGDATFLLHPSTVPLFGELLKAIEDNLASFGCTSYGVSTNTLEDVFVNISEREAKAKEEEMQRQAALKQENNPNKTTSVHVGERPSDDTSVNDKGAPLEEIFAAAAMLPIWAHLPFQIFATLKKRSWMFFRSGRSILISLIVPFLLVGIGFGAVIPNFMPTTSISWAASYSNQKWPDVRHVHVTCFQEQDTWTPALDQTISLFQQMYTTYYEKRGMAGAAVTFQKVSKRDFNTGAFLGGSSISFLQSHNPMMQMKFHDTWVSNFTNEPLYPKAKTSYYFDSTDWAGLYLLVFHELFVAATETVWRQHQNIATPVVFPFGVPVPMPVPTSNATTPAPTTTTPAPTTAAPQQKRAEFVLVALGAIINICVAQFVAGCILPLAEEWNRRIYHTSRIHGLSAAGFWIGTFLFDFINGLLIVIAYIIGAYARGVTQIQNDLLVCQCVFLTASIINAILISYAVVLYAPENLKQSTYLYIVSGVQHLFLIIPLIIMVAMMSTGSGKYPDWISAMTPPRALLDVIIANPSNPSDIWTKKATVAGYISNGIFMGVFAFLLVYKVYITQVRERSMQEKTHHHQSPQPPIPPVGVPTPYAGLGYQQEPQVIYGLPLGSTADVMDVDVLKEQERVLTQPHGNNMAITAHLRKVFRSVSSASGRAKVQQFFDSLFGYGTDKVAVKDVTFGIRSGECFGLLGPNGAGKTTTVKMLLRELPNTAGDIFYPYTGTLEDPFYYPLGGVDTAYRQARLGCCQQHDTLWENLDAREHLELYLRFRLGPLYNHDDYIHYIQHAINKVYLEEAGTKLSGRFSGGMKRKLSVCIAMYTGAKTVFLDEPSTGMDPYARRALWRSINEALQSDRCVLLTTHSMEEADAVCSRIAIMTNGSLQCIGNGVHLKQRFGKGYSIVVTQQEPEVVEDGGALLNDASDVGQHSQSQIGMTPVRPQVVSAAEVDAAMRELFGENCQLAEVLGPQRRYSVPTLPRLSYAFASLESRRVQLGLRSYSVNQMSSLDQIFLLFAGSNAGDGN